MTNLLSTSWRTRKAGSVLSEEIVTPAQEKGENINPFSAFCSLWALTDCMMPAYIVEGGTFFTQSTG